MMTAKITTPLAPTPDTAAQPTAKGARTLMTCGVIAGPLYIVVATAQVLTRDGFDLRRHAVSLLSNGDLGWIQIANFVLTGVLTVAGAVGIRRVLRSDRRGRWGARLIGVYGVSLIAAGALVADPALGFPTGTPAGPPAVISWHGAGHFIAGAAGFLALIAACFVVARRFAALGQRGWAVYSVTTGVLFSAAFAGIASGTPLDGVNVAFAVAVVLGWAWISGVEVRLMADQEAST